MSHFYAEISRSARKTPATARGHIKTGMAANVASWEGCVSVELFHDSMGHTRDGLDRYRVTLKPWYGRGPSAVLVEGVLGRHPNEDPNFQVGADWLTRLGTISSNINNT